MKKLPLLVSVMVVCGAGLASAQATAPSGSLIVNGSFEAPVIAGPFALFSSIPGWQPTGSCGDIEIDRNAFGAAAEGNQSIELNTTCVNGVSQVVATTPGASYSLAFAFAARPGTTAAQNQMNIRFDGSVVDQLGPQAPGANLQWSLHQYEVTATGSSAALSFQGSDPTVTDGVGTELDFVSLVPLVLRAGPFTAIPESLSVFDVVCPSPSVCLVMGFDPTFSKATLTVITGGIPGPTQLIPGFDPVRLTCVSPTSCFAVGTTDSSELEGVLVPITNGVVGSLQAVPGTGILFDVACASATSCVATGTSPGTAAVVVPITDGIAGPPQPVPGAGVLLHVSCPSATSCVAIGRTNDVKGVVVPITHGVAGPTQVVAGTDFLDAIACPSPSTCVAVGGVSPCCGVPSVGGFVVAITGGTAGPAQFIAPNVSLFSVACTDASHCVAVGADSAGVGSGVVVAIDDGVAGSYQAVPGTDLNSVACSTSCVAVGTDNSFSFATIVPISGGVPGSAQYAGRASILWKLACGAGGCMAVGDDFLGSVGGFLAIRPAATPTISTLASPSVPAGGLISDSATLTGGSAPTGIVTFTLYGPGDATCSNALRSTTVPVGAGGVSNSGNVKVGAAGTYNWVATYSGDLNNLPVSSVCGSEPVVITPQTLSGRAYGLSANVSLHGMPLIDQPPTPDTGEIVTTRDSSTSVPCVAKLEGPLHAHALCASVITTAFPAGSTALASVADLSLSLATLHHVEIGAVQATSTTRCDGSTGATTIAYLQIGSTVVAPNTQVTVGPVSLVLNEQVPGPTGGLTVNGIHLSVTGGGLAQANLVVGSARSGIANCP